MLFTISLIVGLVAYNAALYLVLTKRGQALIMGIGKQKAADPVHQAGTTSSTGASSTTTEDARPAMDLAVFDNQSPLNKEQVLLAVRLYAQSKARYDVLTARSRDEWLAYCAEAADGGSISTYYSAQGATMYGTGEIFLKYPDIAPQEFINAWNDSYKAASMEARQAIKASMVAASV